MKKLLVLTCLFFFLIICTACDSNSTFISLHSHKFDEWHIIENPSCFKVGMQKRECSCGEVQTSEIPLLDHDYSKEETITEPTCTTPGVKRLTCSNCSSFIDTEFKLDKLSPSDLYEQALSYVGEIVTYDKWGEELALATGFVYSDDGKIITNYHVIEGAYSAKIIIDGQSYKITNVLAYDKDIDLAVLKINATFDNYATVCSQPISVGSTVYAFGSSRGLTDTFSQGVVTHYNRVLDGVNYLQHDASITHGNSGGPLFNEYGEVVGINTWGISDSQNLNFAVFTSELGNLIYDTPLTMEEFFRANYDPHTLLKEWIINNYNNSGEGWIAFDYHASSSQTIMSIAYLYDIDLVAIGTHIVLSNGAIITTQLGLPQDPTKCRYLATYTDKNVSYKNNETSGYINAHTFTSSSSLTCTSYEGTYYIKSKMLATYQESITLSISWLKQLLITYNIGPTIKDLGFTSFK